MVFIAQVPIFDCQRLEAKGNKRKECNKHRQTLLISQ